MTQRPCRVGDRIRVEGFTTDHKLTTKWFVEWVNEIRAVVTVTITRCGQCGKAVPSECRCFEDSETGGD